jgi:hypothetical protein
MTSLLSGRGLYKESTYSDARPRDSSPANVERYPSAMAWSPGFLRLSLRRRPGDDRPELPRPLTRSRVAAWFRTASVSFFIDSRSRVGTVWQGRVFGVQLLGDRKEILHVRGQWHRQAAIERHGELLETCNEWNADRILPTVYTKVRDDGRISVLAEVTVDFEHGATDDQIGHTIAAGLSGGTQFFDWLDHRFPDPIGLP